MHSITNAVGTPVQQGPIPFSANIISLLLMFIKDVVPLFIAVLFPILYCFQYFDMLRRWSLGREDNFPTPFSPKYVSFVLYCSIRS